MYILGVKVDVTSKAEVLAKVKSYLARGYKFYIVTPNPEIILKADRDPNFKEVINRADISIPDGVGLKLANIKLTIIKGRELMESLLILANNLELKVYLLGSTQLSNHEALRRAKKLYPKIKLCSNNGPYLDVQGNTLDETQKSYEKEVLAEINSFQPDILFVGFGAPKQEYWIYKHVQRLKIGGAMAVGGSIDYFSGHAARVPGWVSDIGIEWLYRLMRQPSRLGRIFNAVIVFPLKLLQNIAK